MLIHLWSYLQWWMLFAFTLAMIAFGKELLLGLTIGKIGGPAAEAFVALNRAFLVFVALFTAYAISGLIVAATISHWLLTVVLFVILIAIMLKALGGSTVDYRKARLIREFSFTVAGLVALFLISPA
jgi:hypothetical protein